MRMTTRYIGHRVHENQNIVHTILEVRMATHPLPASREITLNVTFAHFCILDITVAKCRNIEAWESAFVNKIFVAQTPPQVAPCVTDCKTYKNARALMSLKQQLFDCLQIDRLFRGITKR